ncbi:MAG: hypothetical protein QXO33_03465 [Nitrososphaeria archaeon]
MKLFTGNIYKRTGITKFELKYKSDPQFKLAKMIDPRTERVIGEDWIELERIALAQVFGNNRYRDVTPRAEGIKAPDRRFIDRVKEEVRLFSAEDIAPVVRTAPKEVQEAFSKVVGGIAIRDTNYGDYRAFFFTEKGEAEEEFKKYVEAHEAIKDAIRRKEKGAKLSSIIAPKLSKEQTLWYAFRLIKQAVIDSAIPATEEKIDEITLLALEELSKENNLEEVFDESN